MEKIDVRKSFYGENAIKTYCNGCMEDKKVQVKEVVIGGFTISICDDCLRRLNSCIERELSNKDDDKYLLDSKNNKIFIGDKVLIHTDMFKKYSNTIGFDIRNQEALIADIDIHCSLPLKVIVKGRELSMLPYDVEKIEK